MDWIDPAISLGLSMGIFHSLWMGAVIYVLVRIIARCIPKKDSQFIHILYTAGLFSLLVSFISAVWLNYEGGEIMGVSSYVADDTLGSIHRHFTGEVSGTSFHLDQIAVILWLAGMMVFFLRLVLGYSSLYFIRRSAMPGSQALQDRLNSLLDRLSLQKQVVIAVSNRISVPMIVGFLRPAVIFPVACLNQLEPEEVESILIHELTHIMRADFLIGLFQSFVESVLFFNPFTWLLSNEMKRYREYACDDMVRRHIDNDLAYLHALYKVACFSGHSNIVSIKLFSSKSELVMRVKRMLSQSIEENYIRPLIGFFSIAAMATIFFAFQEDSASEYQLAETEAIAPAITEVSVAPMAPVKEKTSEIPAAAPAAPVKETTPEVPVAASVAPKAILTLTNILSETVGVALSVDSVPDSERIRELETLLEQKLGELEELTEQLTEEMEGSIEIDVERIEVLAEQLEEIIEEKMEGFEERMEALGHDRMEELGEKLEERIEVQMASLEEILESEFIEELEASIEAMVKEIEEAVEKDEDGNAPAIQKMQQKLREMEKRMEKEVNKIHEAQSKVMDDPEIKRIQVEMEKIGKEIEAESAKMEDIWTDEAKAIEKEMAKVEEEIHIRVNKLNTELQEKIESKAKEIEKISRELEKERNKK
jgi:beta-lactamase regulating signal transducer with metallopeptidase domain